MLDPTLQRRMTIPILFCMMCGVGMYLVNLIGTSGPYIFALFFTAAFLIVWIFCAGPGWWLPLPAAVTFGGAFFFAGFKIHLHEMAFPLCVLALLPAVALGRTANVSTRAPLSRSVWLLVGLFVIEWLFSFFVLKSRGMGGGGSLSRVYFHGFWPVLFLVLFYSFGDSRLLRAALILMWVACILRVIVATAAFFATDLLYLPYLNFVFSSSTGVVDFRFSGIQLLLLGLCLAYMSRARTFKVLNLAMALFGAGLILFGGGRVSVGMLCTIPMFWGLLMRRTGTLVVASSLILAVVIFLNRQPEVIYQFPPTVQRALSILVRESRAGGVDWHEDLRGSNEWHRRLGELGRQRWLSSPVTFLVGARAEPYDENFATRGQSVERRMQVAAGMGLYESGLWTVLGLTGICGVLIYSGVFWYLLKDVARSIWREGLTTAAHVIGSMALVEVALWVLFSWFAGGFPSQELLMAILARFAWEDGRRQTEAQPVVS
jgi:hypothetical protein